MEDRMSAEVAHSLIETRRAMAALRVVSARNDHMVQRSRLAIRESRRALDLSDRYSFLFFW